METLSSHSLPPLSLHQLDNPRRVGRQWCCTCPVCGTRHLYVNPTTGLFKCFYAGCPYKGIAEEKKTRRSRSEHPRNSFRREAPLRASPQPAHRSEDGCDYLFGQDND